MGQSKEDIKAYIDRYVKANGNQEITGPVMNGVLKEMIDSENDWATEGSVRYDKAQSLTTTQQAQARTNINAADADNVILKDATGLQTMVGGLLAGVFVGDSVTANSDLNINRNADIRLVGGGDEPEFFLKTTTGQSTKATMTQKAISDETSRLDTRINNVSARGRYLSNWDAASGMPYTNPTTELPYQYRAGDYYIVGVGVVSSKAITVDGNVYRASTTIVQGRRAYRRLLAGPHKWFPVDSIPAVNDEVYSDPMETTPTGGTVTAVVDNYGLEPEGIQYSGTPSTTQTPAPVNPGSIYIFDGNRWIEQTTGTEATFGSLGGVWSDNTSLLTKMNSVDAAIDKTFYATYGTTTWEEIYEAKTNGSSIFLNWEGLTMTFVNDDAGAGNVFLFSGVDENGTIKYAFVNMDDEWSFDTVATERTVNRVTSISSTSTDYTYPTSKAVYDAIQSNKEVAIVAYGTPYQDIKDAYDDGKVVFCTNGENILALNIFNSTRAQFTSAHNNRVYVFNCYYSNVWTQDNYYLEQTNNKVTNITSESTNTQYPSAKAVYDAVQEANNIFIVERGVTPYADILAAWNANKTIYFKGRDWGGLFTSSCSVSYIPNDRFVFSCIYNGTNWQEIVTINNVWQYYDTTMLERAYVRTEIQSANRNLYVPNQQCLINYSQPKTTSSVKTYASGTTYTLVANEIATLDASAAASGDSITIALPDSPAVTDCFDIQITLGVNVPTINLPASVSWLGGSTPSFSANKKYEINIMNNLAVAGEF